ncbi:GGDEF domain-containing protein [Roseateles violae]|uniref:Sensor domain-containing diguanylate cyclase n=1 Tax=Roseateles violae TaxID=3058042 RepID=A0ABT8DR76_9BURK|nr:sensor domain-containing diguanylate cyclase [Pelomonas sp. PFR6]MDN3920526.1 sensor domain-containing diguanylate cyclase [Pelomonas sp. PFR6]
MDTVLLAQLSTALPAARSLEQLTRPLLEMLSKVTGLESTYLTMIDFEADVQHILFARNAGTMTIPEGLSVPWSDTLCKRALEEGRMATTDVPACWGDSDAARQLGIQTYLSTPVRGEQDELLGTLCAASGESRGVGGEAEAVLRLFSQLIGDFIERERLLERLRQANEQLLGYALLDTLTGLPNRRALLDELKRRFSQARREGRSVLVGLIDLDGFKSINDRYGHHCGDLFLQEQAGRLSAVLRGGDVLGRLGGDEFVLVSGGPALDAQGLAGELAGKAAAALQRRCAEATVGEFQLGEHRLDYAGASIGVVALAPRQVPDVEAALTLADAAMYEVKRQRQARR